MTYSFKIIFLFLLCIEDSIVHSQHSSYGISSLYNAVNIVSLTLTSDVTADANTSKDSRPISVLLLFGLALLVLEVLHFDGKLGLSQTQRF